jgi:hypothetical protein
VADEVACVGGRVRRQVEELVGRDAGERVARDVADGVAAALAGGQAGLGRLADQGRSVLERHVVELDVLARRDVALVERDPLLDHVGEHLHLLRRHAAHRQLDADHLDVGLALAVDALLEAELDEFLFGRLAVEVLVGAGVEVVELPLDDRDDVARDVLVDDLRVAQGAGAAFLRLRQLGRGGFHGAACFS